jgi:hypothetical protein
MCQRLSHRPAGPASVSALSGEMHTSRKPDRHVLSPAGNARDLGQADLASARCVSVLIVVTTQANRPGPWRQNQYARQSQ